MVENIGFSLVTPYGEIFNDYVRSVNLPGADGEFTVLAGHCDLLSLLQAGVIEVVRDNGKRELIAINWGYVEVTSNSISVLANGAVYISGDSDSEIHKSIEDSRKLLEDAASSKDIIVSVLSRIESSAKQS